MVVFAGVNWLCNHGYLLTLAHCLFHASHRIMSRVGACNLGETRQGKGQDRHVLDIFVPPSARHLRHDWSVRV